MKLQSPRRRLQLLRAFGETHTLTLKLLLIFFLVISIATASVSVASYRQAAQMLDHHYHIYAQSVAESINLQIDQHISEMDRISRIILGNPQVQRTLIESQSADYSPYERLRDVYALTDLILSFTSIRDGFTVHLYNQNLDQLYSNPFHLTPDSYSLLDNAWFAAQRATIDEQRLLVMPPGTTDQGLPIQLFGIVRSLRPLGDDEVIGYVAVASDVRVLRETVLNDNLLLSGMQIQVADQNGNLVVESSDVALQNLDAAAAPKQFVISHVSERTGWHTTISMYHRWGIIPFTLSGVRNYLLLFSLLTIGAVTFLAILLSNQIFRPIRKMVETMASVRAGDFDIVLEEKGLDFEVRQLYSGFNVMVAEIRRLIHRLYDEKMLTRSAQLEALRYQINPHFIYNTLQTIEAVGEVYNIAEVQTMAQSLGKILRYNVHGGSMVRLHDEIEQVCTYLNIEKIRHADKIDWQIRVDEQVAGYYIPKFILQPIVENCVMHAFRNLQGTGIIEIHATEDAQGLKVLVSDNGRGMSSSRLFSLEEKLRTISESRRFEPEGESVGLANVHKRIVNLYGPGYGLDYTSNENLGTTVILMLPVLAEDPVVQVAAQG